MNSRNFDKQVSVLQRRREKIEGPSDGINLTEFEEIANVEILRRKMERLSKGILLQRMEEEFKSLLSTASSSLATSCSTSKRELNFKIHLLPYKYFIRYILDFLAHD